MMNLHKSLFWGARCSFFIVIVFVSCNGPHKTGLIKSQNVDFKYDSIRVGTNHLTRYYTYDIFEYSPDSIMLLAYNHINHTIDRFNLISNQAYDPIVLAEEGPNSVAKVKSIKVTKNSIIVDTALGIATIKNNIAQTTPYTLEVLNETFLGQKYQVHKMVFISRFGSLGVSPDGLRVAMPSYSLNYFSENNGRPYNNSHVISILNLSDGLINFIKPDYPEIFKENVFLGDLDDLLVRYENNCLIYSFRCTPMVWKYDIRTSETISAKKIPNAFFEPPKLMKRSDFLGPERKKYLAQNKCFYETRFDNFNTKYYRTFKKKTTSNSIFDFTNNYLMQLDDELNYENSYKLREDIIPDIFPTSQGLFAMSKPINEEYLRYTRVDILQDQ